MIAKSKIIEIIHESLIEVRDKPGCFSFTIDEDLILFGHESPLDSIVISRFITLLSEKIEDETDQDFFISLPEITSNNQSHPLTISVLANAIEELLFKETHD